MQSYFEKIMEIIKSRVFIMLVAIFILFSIVALRLFSLQVVHGETYQQNLKTSVIQELSIPAARGMIYDRYGRPLAYNQVAFSLMLDDSINIVLPNRNQILANFVTAYSETDTTVSDNLPISVTTPYKFTFDSETDEAKWKESIGLTKKQLDFTASEVLNYLFEKYEVPSNLSLTYGRKIVSLGMELNDKNLMLLSLINVLDANNETLVDDVPISTSQPYGFLYDGRESSELDWKSSVGMTREKLQYNAQESIEYLEGLFGVPKNLSSEMKRKLITLRYSLYLKRYRKYQPVPVALNISNKTIAAVEENNESFIGVTIDTSSLRHYTADEYFSHILGYIRKIDENEFVELKDYGYTLSSIVGKSGVEKLYELNLNGIDGEMIVEVDSSGRRINTIETKPPISGDSVYLTLDMDLQISAYNHLEKVLTDVLISKLTATALKDMPITLKEFFCSMIECDTISLKKILSATGGVQKNIADLLYEQHPDFALVSDEDRKIAQQFIISAINNNKISYRQLINVLIEQEKITASPEYLDRINNGSVSALSVVLTKLQAGELRPSDTNLDPCSGSVVVNYVSTGETLALVTYPSYDNNRLVNTFNNDYYSFLLNHPSTPLVNRPLRERKAPGSTFKMITALTVLENNTVTPTSLIQDHGLFTSAKKPYARCWIHSSGGHHGTLNIKHALEVSCNYYFYEAIFRIGNQDQGNSSDSIAALNKYTEAFGLNDHSGIEIGEAKPNMASPEYKEASIKWQNPDATVSQTRWTDGDTIRAAIGQSVNNFAPIHMNKYISTLANGGTRYSSYLIDKVETPDGTLISQAEPYVELVTEFKQENLNAVYEGMLLVTQGSSGTLRGVFNDYPINVAAKSGTAQEALSRSSHTWFVGFAPYEDPQISITVMIPFGESPGAPAAVVAKNVISEYMGLNYEPENSYYMESNLAY